MDEYERDENRVEQLDRHWIELLQELRLAQTGTQIFFAFLLTIAFTQPFRDADRFTHLVFAGTLITSAIAMGLFLAPVSFHRLTYQKKVRDKMLPIAGRLTIVGMVFLVIAIAGGLMLALDVVLGRNEAYVVVAVVVAIVLVSWYGLPAWVRRVS
jgi:Family of unknown function (DUF6328)